MKFKYLLIPALILGTAIGYFSGEMRSARDSNCVHLYGRWQSSGQMGGVTRSKVVMQRSCVKCGSLESKLAD